MKTFYLTTPIYYPNARPHVGSAYTTIVCDVIARYKRMCGYDVAFLTGTDEHGEKLQRAAEAEGKSPAEFVASKRELFRKLWRVLNISEYRFVHTSQNPDHVRSVQWMLQQAEKNGYIEKKRYEGRYCVSDERYVSDNTDAVNCDICGRSAELISEENYFFKLSAFQDRLLELYEKHPEFVQPHFRHNEVTSFVRSGLRDISVSRHRIKWGVPWPDDPDQVFYVWYDALTSYMTGIGFKSVDPVRKAEFQKYWHNDPAAGNEIVHMIGKDILRFHAVYWPAFIMAAFPDQPEMLPTTIFAHGWIYYEEDKMSKSKGNVVYPEPIVDALNSFGAPGNDALRYYLLREAPFGQDTSFSYDALIQRYNSDLANGLGNLASRTLAMISRYCGGNIPDFAEFKRRVPGWDQGLRWDNLAQEVSAAYEAFNLSSAAEKIWKVIAHYGDEFLATHQPWTHADNPERRYFVEGILYIALEAVRAAAVLAYPILPKATEKIWAQLGCEDYLGKLKDQSIDQIKWGELRPGVTLGKPEPIFPRLDKDKTLAKLHELAEADYNRDKPKEATKSVESEPPSGTGRGPQELPGGQPVKQDTAKMAVPQAPNADQKISIEDFAKVEMRVGEVLSAEPIPGATKLLKLQVDIGTEVRQVCAGIAEHYPPEQLVGMKVILVTNLQPRKLRGVESNGMILAASVGEQGKPILATFKEDVPKGAKLK
jgi:methionyl-tRNA synthetase